MKATFKRRLQRNLEIVYDTASIDGSFLVNRRSATTCLLLLSADKPSNPGRCSSYQQIFDCDGGTASFVNAGSRPFSPSSLIWDARSVPFLEYVEVDDASVPRRKRSQDLLERYSNLHKRKATFSLIAQHSNIRREMKFDEKNTELAKHNASLPQFLERNIHESEIEVLGRLVISVNYV